MTTINTNIGAISAQANMNKVNNDFNTLLELGFASSIRKEWAWRLARGESLKNLQAFRHLIEETDGGDNGSANAHPDVSGT